MNVALPLPARRGRWLMTFLDLALLLIGFLVAVQIVDRREVADRRRMAAGLRAAFGGGAEAQALDVARVAGFALGVPDAPHDAARLTAWARSAAMDPRTQLVVTGFARPGESDAPLALAARRATAIAEALRRDGAVPATRIVIEARLAPQPPRVDLGIRYQPSSPGESP